MEFSFENKNVIKAKINRSKKSKTHNVIQGVPDLGITQLCIFSVFSFQCRNFYVINIEEMVALPKERKVEELE